MAAPVLTILETPEMAAAVIPKKERVPTSITAPVLLVLFSQPSTIHISIPTPQPNPFSCTT